MNKEKNIDNTLFADPPGTSLLSNAIYDYTSVGGINYVNPETEYVLKGSVEKNERPQSPQVSEGIWLMDIAQSHHYTVWLAGMEGMSGLQVPHSPLTRDLGFLPVKTMNLKYTSYENMSVPVAIFGDFPLLNKKRVSTIDLSCYDYDNNKLEYELRKWEAQCFPKGRFVAYMEDIAREFRYRGYSVEGKLTLEYKVFVIPAGNVSVSRDYSANEAKMVNFSLVVVGDGRTCATGEGKIPVEDHGGDGNGYLPKGPFHTLYATGYGQWDPKTESFHDL
jgi:hypothetical protein